MGSPVQVKKIKKVKVVNAIKAKNEFPSFPPTNNITGVKRRMNMLNNNTNDDEEEEEEEEEEDIVFEESEDSSSDEDESFRGIDAEIKRRGKGKKQKPVRWSEAEINALYKGVHKYGTNWAKIRRKYDNIFQRHRVSGSLGYKYKCMEAVRKEKGESSEAEQGSSSGDDSSSEEEDSNKSSKTRKYVMWSKEELIALHRGHSKYGSQWALILKKDASSFHKSRNVKKIRIKWVTE